MKTTITIKDLLAFSAYPDMLETEFKTVMTKPAVVFFNPMIGKEGSTTEKILIIFADTKDSISELADQAAAIGEECGAIGYFATHGDGTIDYMTVSSVDRDADGNAMFLGSTAEETVKEMLRYIGHIPKSTPAISENVPG